MMWRPSMSCRWRSRSASEDGGVTSALPVGILIGALALIAGCTAFEALVSKSPSPAAGAAQVQAAAPAPKAPPARIAFDHKFHLSRGPQCLDCHEGADTKDLADMPKLETCMECHEDIDKKKTPE